MKPYKNKILENTESSKPLFEPLRKKVNKLINNSKKQIGKRQGLNRAGTEAEHQKIVNKHPGNAKRYSINMFCYLQTSLAINIIEIYDMIKHH